MFCWNLFTQAVLTVVKYWGIDFKRRGHRASVWATCRRRFRRMFSIKSGVGFSGKIVMHQKLFCVVMLLASSAQPPRRRKRQKKTIKLTRWYLTRYESTIAEVCFAASNVLFVWQNIAANQISILSINNASFDMFPIFWVAIDKAWAIRRACLVFTCSA